MTKFISKSMTSPFYVRLSANPKKLRKQHKKDSVKMENEAFNKRSLVTAGDTQEAYYVLTPT